MFQRTDPLSEVVHGPLSRGGETGPHSGGHEGETLTLSVCSRWTLTNTALRPPQALEYLFKFIVQSRILYSRATCGMEEEQFRSSIQELFQSIRFVLSLDSRNSETLIFTQVTPNGRSLSVGWFFLVTLVTSPIVRESGFHLLLV